MDRIFLASAISLLPLWAAAQEAPDAIYTGGNVVTIAGSGETAEAFAVTDGRFVGVGSDIKITQLAGDDTEQIDLKGRTVIPGLIDTHLHQLRAALNLPAVSLIESHNMADLTAAIGKRVDETEPV